MQFSNIFLTIGSRSNSVATKTATTTNKDAPVQLTTNYKAPNEMSFVGLR